MQQKPRITLMMLLRQSVLPQDLQTIDVYNLSDVSTITYARQAASMWHDRHFMYVTIRGTITRIMKIGAINERQRSPMTLMSNSAALRAAYLEFFQTVVRAEYENDVPLMMLFSQLGDLHLVGYQKVEVELFEAHRIMALYGDIEDEDEPDALITADGRIFLPEGQPDAPVIEPEAELLVPDEAIKIWLDNVLWLSEEDEDDTI